jgi:hypothetical protein
LEALARTIHIEKDRPYERSRGFRYELVAKRATNCSTHFSIKCKFSSLRNREFIGTRRFFSLDFLFLFDSRLYAFGGQEAKRKRPAAGEALQCSKYVKSLLLSGFAGQ